MNNIFSVIPNEERIRVAKTLVTKVANKLEDKAIHLPQSSVVLALKLELEKHLIVVLIIAEAKQVAIGLDYAESHFHSEDKEPLLHKILEGKKIYLTSYKE